MNKRRYWDRSSVKQEKSINHFLSMCKNVTLSHASIKSIDTYIANYKGYFRELYVDTGIWWEDIIIENYLKESRARKDEIYDLLERRLSSETVLWRTPNNTLFLGWRSKILFVEWEDHWEDRAITTLSIR